MINDAELHIKVLERITGMDSSEIDKSQRVLIVYYVHAHSFEDSKDVGENNLKLFISAMLSQTARSVYHTYCIFRIVGGITNVYSKYIPPDMQYTAQMKISHDHEYLAAQFHTVAILDEAIMGKFGSVLFLSNHVRGPFFDRQNGEWLKHFLEPMKQHPEIGIVGPSISCEGGAHIQTHAFALRSEIALHLSIQFSGHKKYLRKRKVVHNHDIQLSTEITELGYQLSAIYYTQRFGLTMFGGHCASGTSNSILFMNNPTSWCQVRPENILFMKWGGAPLRVRGYYCQDTVDSVRNTTLQITQSEPTLELTIPETYQGNGWYTPMKEYDVELYRQPYVVQKLLKQSSSTPQKKVCLIVRTAHMHGERASRASRTVPMDLKVFVTCKSCISCSA